MAEITPESVERLIDQAGRDRVFALARENGWSVDRPPPLWVWQQIAIEVMATPEPRPFYEGLSSLGAHLN